MAAVALIGKLPTLESTSLRGASDKTAVDNTVSELIASQYTKKTVIFRRGLVNKSTALRINDTVNEIPGHFILNHRRLCFLR